MVSSPEDDDQTRRWLGWFALTVIIGMQAGTLFRPLGSIGETRVADWIDLLTPFALIGCAGMVLDEANSTRERWVRSGVGSVAFTLGHGLLLSALRAPRSPSAE